MTAAVADLAFQLPSTDSPAPADPFPGPDDPELRWLRATFPWFAISRLQELAERPARPSRRPGALYALACFDPPPELAGQVERDFSKHLIAATARELMTEMCALLDECRGLVRTVESTAPTPALADPPRQGDGTFGAPDT
jgi:hypothetical protein